MHAHTQMLRYTYITLQLVHESLPKTYHKLPWDEAKTMYFYNTIISLYLNKVVVTKKERRKERRQKMTILQPHTFAFSCFPRCFWALII